METFTLDGQNARKFGQKLNEIPELLGTLAMDKHLIPIGCSIGDKKYSLLSYAIVIDPMQKWLPLKLIKTKSDRRWSNFRF